MQAVLIIIHLFVAIALIIVVLLQRSEGGALGMGGSGGGLGGLFSPRGAADALTRTTMILGALFFLSSIALILLGLGGHAGPTTVLDRVPAQTQNTPAPAKGPVPPPTLPSNSQSAPAAPAGPAKRATPPAPAPTAPPTR